MSVHTQTHETVSEASEVSEKSDVQIDLNELVAQTTSTVDALPDWDVYDAACDAIRDTLKCTITTEVTQ